MRKSRRERERKRERAPPPPHHHICSLTLSLSLSWLSLSTLTSSNLTQHIHTHTHTETNSSTNARNIFCFFVCSYRNTSGFMTRTSVRAYVSYPERERLSRPPPWIRPIEVHPNSRVSGTKILMSFRDINVLRSVNTS